MRVLYLDCFSGISGDMVVGALTDLGVTPSAFEWELSKLELEDFHLHFDRQTRGGIAGVKFDVHAGATHTESHCCEHQHEHQHDDGHEHRDHGGTDKSDPPHTSGGDAPGRTFSDIKTLIQASELSDFVKEHAVSIFRRIAEAEAKIHGAPVEEIRFHEIGAVDSIVDIVLASAGIEALKVERIYFSDLYEGRGTFRCSHGEYPLPAPATLEILKGIPISQVQIPFELITPTGAAIVAEFQHSVGFLPRMRSEKVGYGIGQRDLKHRPNVLRAAIGQLESEQESARIVELQANIDDLSPEIVGAAQKRLFEAGALDVFLVPVQMKKNRPGTILTVLCRPSDCEVMQEILFAETSTFGIRYREMDRVTLERELVEVETPAGIIQMKIGRRFGRIVQVAPEFESCEKAARASGQPLKQIYEIALRAFRSDLRQTRFINSPAT